MNRYGLLFDAYVSELRKSKALAEAWWAAALDAESASCADPAQAKENLDMRWPFGCAAHPFVLATYRKYFLECEALNELVESAEDDDPEEQADDEADWGESDGEFEADEVDGIDFEGPEQPVSPHALLIDLLPGRHPDLEQFMNDMVFAPIGLDDDDRSV